MDATDRSGGRSRHLEEMTWPEVAAAVAGGARTVILPLGATEQHGPHLPLGTDTIRAAALAGKVAARVAGVLVAPALPLGCSDEHAGFPGLLGVQAETLASVIVDCAHRLQAWGVTRLVLLSAHGGNGRALARCRARLQAELPELRVWSLDVLDEIAAALKEIAQREGISAEAFGLHAGEGETSEILRLRPELVRRERAEPGFAGDMRAILPRLRESGLRPVTANGVLGDPRAASAVRGERYLEAVAGAIARVLRRDDYES